MEIIAAVVGCVVGVVLGGMLVYSWPVDEIAAEIESRDEEILRLKSVIDAGMVALKSDVWEDAKAAARAEFDAEWERQQRTFRLPVIEGRTLARTKLFTRRFFDMKLRGVDLTYRNAAESGIGRTVFNDFREWFVALGYWSWSEGETPKWTARGYEYMRWFELRHMTSADVISAAED